MIRTGAVVFCLAGLAVSVAHGRGQPEVTLDSGPLRGLYEATLAGREVAAFRGIPYAKPPSGKHRFKEPVPAIPWQGVLNATRPPPDCLQYDHFTYLTPYPVRGSEDCLYLNVFTPKIPSGAAGETLKEVIVFIHGGAFMFHSGAPYQPTVLLDKDVLLVTINYRLGPLGFLSTEDGTVPGNNGLKDQVLALKWVQANIDKFGGDPKKVTISGMSAGSASVHFHTLSPLSKGLFHRAIMQSGSSLAPWAVAEGSLEKAKYIAHNLGCPTNDNFLMVRCLRGRPADHIVHLSSHFMGFLYSPYTPFGPVIEPEGPTAFLSDEPVNILSSGLAHDVPILASFTTEEGLYPGADIVGRDPEQKNLRLLSENWHKLAPHLLDYNWTLAQEKHEETAQKIKDYYNIDLSHEKGIKNLIDMLGDRLFVHGVKKAMKLHGTHGTAPTYLYRFAYKGFSSSAAIFTDKDYGVSHADDTFYVLPTGFTHHQDTEEDRELSRFMANVWADFARDGKLGEPWVEVGASINGIQELRGVGRLEFVEDPDLGHEKFWDSLGLLENLITVKHDEL